MDLFTKNVPKEINNIFEEFENIIPIVIEYSEAEYFDFENNKFLTENYIEFLTNNKIIDNHFQYFAELIKKTILMQLEKSNSIELVTYFESQKIFLKEFTPNKRKKEIYNSYLFYNIASGDKDILNSNYKLSIYEKKLIELVYEKYLIAYKNLEKEIFEIYLMFNIKQTKTETKTNKLKVKQIALIHVYEGKEITRGNAVAIAAKHGYNSESSGEGLFQDFTFYRSTANRKGKPTPFTPKRLKNKIELFESVINHLSDNNKQRAIDEINILKTIYQNEYQ